MVKKAFNTLFFSFLSQNRNGIAKVGWESKIRYMGCRKQNKSIVNM